MQPGLSARGKQNKERRPDTGLRNKLDLEPRKPALDRSRRRSAFGLRHGVFEKSIEQRCLNAAVSSLVSLSHKRQNLCHALAGQCRDRHDRCPIEELHRHSQSMLKPVDRICFLFLDSVPFIDHDDHRTARIDRVTRNVSVEICNALDRVDNDDRNVGTLRQRQERDHVPPGPHVLRADRVRPSQSRAF